jgi:hypothetical protein
MPSFAPKTVAIIERQREHLAAITLSNVTPQSEITAARSAINQAFMEGYHWVTTLSALLALISAMSAAALIPGKPDGERRSFIEEQDKSP